MRTNSDPERDDALLDAMLCDEHWQAASAGFKEQALRTFRVRQRTRRLTRWAGSAAVLAAVVVGATHWFRVPSAAPRQVMMAHAIVPKAAPGPRQLTDAELLASFPKGSCFIAEVDGKKQLIFFDRKVEHACIGR
jgi:hypothetical protein